MTQVEIEAGPPTALLVPANLLSLPLQEACWQIGRQLGHLRAGTHAIARIPGKDLGLLVVAGVRTVFPDYGRGMLPEEQLNDVAQKIARMLPRRQRRAFEQAALSFRDGGVFEASAGARPAAHGHRAALVARGTCSARSSRSRAGTARLAGRGACTPDELSGRARAPTPKSSS